MGAIAKFGRFQIAHKIWGELNAWNGRYIDVAAKTGLFALLDRSRYDVSQINNMQRTKRLQRPNTLHVV